MLGSSALLDWPTSNALCSGLVLYLYWNWVGYILDIGDFDTKLGLCMVILLKFLVFVLLIQYGYPDEKAAVETQPSFGKESLGICIVQQPLP